MFARMSIPGPRTTSLLVALAMLCALAGPAARARANPIVDPRIREMTSLAVRMESDASPALDRRFGEILDALGFDWIDDSTLDRMASRPGRFMPLVLASQRPGRPLDWRAQSFCRLHGDAGARASMCGQLRLRLRADGGPGDILTATAMLAAWRDTGAIPLLDALAGRTAEERARSGFGLALARLRGRGCDMAWVAPDGRGGVTVCSAVSQVRWAAWRGPSPAGALRALSDAEREKLWGAMRSARECQLRSSLRPLLAMEGYDFGNVSLARQPGGGYAVGDVVEARFAVMGEKLDRVLREIAEAHGDSISFRR